MLAALADAGELLTLRAEVDGRVVAMYIGAAYRKTFYAVDTVSDRRFRKYPASNLMNWQCFAWGCGRGLEAFDFQGANIPSLANFKASFGARLVYYSNITKAHSRSARLAIRLKAMTVEKLRELRFRRSKKGRKQAGTKRRLQTSAPDALPGARGSADD
jgi:lipid II:glycine glycyltransferase (peptidoglycan interpeptide bridge formation enzyme)